MSWARRAFDMVFGPCDAIRLTSFRALFCYTLALYSLHRFQYAGEWLTTAGYHADGRVVAGQYPFPPLPPAWLPAFAVVYLGSLAALCLGWRPRLTIWPTLAGVIYVTFVDRLSAFTINQLFIAVLGILALAPPITRGPDGRETLRSAWPLRALQVTLALQLFGAGVCKVLGEWPGEGDILWHQVQYMYMTEAAAWMVRTLPLWAWAGLQHLALGFELLAPALLLVPRLRPLAFLLALGMFGMIAVTMQHLVFFALQMLSFFVLFADEAWLARVRGALRRRGG